LNGHDDLPWCEDAFYVRYNLYRIYAHPGNGYCLLYVGISNNWPRRIKEHMKKDWFVDVVRIDLEDWCCEPHALEAERRAIQTERPAYNVVHNPRPALV
jgi:predicted GIY-YIG superfamily endonuclease